MNDAELTEMILMSADQIDASFEYWLTVTFGVLVLLHLTRGTLPTRIKNIVCILYVAASLGSLALTIGDALQVASYMKEMNADFPGQTPNMVGLVLRLLLYFAGTITVATAVYRYDRWMERDA